MEKRAIITLKEYREDLLRRKQIQEQRRSMLAPQRRIVLSRRKASKNRWYYYSRNVDGKDQKYLGVCNTSEVNEIKELRYLDKSLALIEKNIEVVEMALGKIKRTDYDYVNALIPDTYRSASLRYSHINSEKGRKWKDKATAIKDASPCFKPEELKVWTEDGNKVRSKSEGLIYNFLLSRGVTFAYELPLRFRSRTIYPDFTLLSELDYETEIIIEHQGLMDNEYYRNRFADKVHSYIREGFTPGINVFFTFDDADGGLNMRPVEDIVRMYIKAGDDALA